MGKKVIKVELSTAGINKAISQLNAYQQDLENKAKLLQKKIAERLADEASQGFTNAISDTLVIKGAGLTQFHDAQVQVEIDESRGAVTAVVASGEDTLWIEFGTGVYYNGSAGGSPHPSGAELGMTIGGYGNGYGKREAWGWSEDGEHFVSRGVPAQMPMSKAMATVVNELYQIAKEVFT